MHSKELLRKALLDLTLDISEMDGIGHFERQGLSSYVSEVYNEVTFGDDTYSLWCSLDSLRDYLEDYRFLLRDDLIRAIEISSLDYCRQCNTPH